MGEMPRGGEGEPSDNLYICGLPEGFDTDSVQQFFSAIGNIQQCKSFGYGYALVRFSSLEEATLVKNSLSGQQPAGCVKPLVITYAASERKPDWVCPNCGDKQFAKNVQCRMCQTPRSAATGAGDVAGRPHYAGEGDWVCGSCGDLQFKKNKSCRLCGAAPPADGGSGGGSPEEQTLLALQASYGKAQGKTVRANPWTHHPVKGKSKGPQSMCKTEDFLNELLAGGLPGGDFDQSMNCIWVSGLPRDCTNEHLYHVFATFGALPPNGARIEVDAGTGLCDGTGAINFLEATNADMAVMALNGIQLATGATMQIIRK